MASLFKLKSYYLPIILLCSIFLGSIVGSLDSHSALRLKPLGDIFLNLIFTAIIPLIFFSVTSAVAKAGKLGNLSKILSGMVIIFLLTGFIAAAYMLVIVKLFPPAKDFHLSFASVDHTTTVNLANQFVGIFTVPEFSTLLSHNNILPLIIFSILIGLAIPKNTENGKLFIQFLQAGEEVFMRVFSLIMYYAPIGFFAYFAVLVSELGPKIMADYAQIALIYYVSAFIYFIVAYTLFAYLVGKWDSVKLFWKNIFLPMITALATCSSAACIPANLTATKNMRVPAEIYETTIPLGTIIHKDGSIMGGMIKIAFLFGIFQMSFTGPDVLLTALFVSLLVGTVMGAIPSGGMLGELLILNVYGFPPSALIAIAAISIIIDPIATMLNVTGNSVCSMIIARFARDP